MIKKIKCFFKKKAVSFIIPVLSVAAGLPLLLSTADGKIADLFQKSLPSTVENPDVVMVNINDDSIENIGAWPLPRNVYASSLNVLKELGCSSFVFDLSFLDDGNLSIKPGYEKILQEQNGLEREEVAPFFNSIIQDSDKLLEESISDFENAYLTLTFGNDFSLSEEEKKHLEEFIALKNIKSNKDKITPEYSGVRPALLKFLKNAKSAGFVNAFPDADGSVRKVNPLMKFEGNYYGQLILPALLEKLDADVLEVNDSHVMISNARLPDGSRKTMKIPRAEDGSIILKFPKKHYREYNAVSLWEIYSICKVEEVLVKNLNIMNDAGFFDSLEINPVYAETRSEFFSSLENIFDGNLKSSLLDEVSSDEFLSSYVEDMFSTAQDCYSDFIQRRRDLKEKVQGKILIIGATATSTSDLGINLYEDHYPNPGVHYTLMNMILSEDFIDDSPVWISILFSLAVCFMYSFAFGKIKSTGRKILTGVFAVLSVCVLLFAFFYLTRIYIASAIPLCSVTLCFVSLMLYGFFTTSREKTFITNAFSQCLSKEIVNQLIAHPASFKLGGEKVFMSAIFTDIRKFSSFSELLSPSQLVALLNFYLTRMSDIIIEEKGTIDKYEGDAIIALVGAPLKMEDHAEHACRAAIKMKKAETSINSEIINAASYPKPLEMEQDLYDAFCILANSGRTIFTRIGINSGEMIAGYMGAEKKKNYTMMGNSVNLASRLEGVNKQYDTDGIMISEFTNSLIGENFIVRKLDRVQVVNVRTPLRIYELIDVKNSGNELLQKYIAHWNSMIDTAENRDYKKALEQLINLGNIHPDFFCKDNVALYYKKLLEKYFINGTYPSEQNDEGVAFDPETGIYKLLQK